MYSLEETQPYIQKNKGGIQYEKETYSGIAMYIVSTFVVG